MSFILLGILNAQAEVADAGSYELIQTVEFDGSEGLVFTNIPQTYQHLELRWRCRSDSTSTGTTGVLLRPNNFTGSTYTRHSLYGQGSSVVSTGSTADSSMYIGTLVRDGNTANIFSAGVTSILDYTSTTKFKTVRSFAGVSGGTNDEEIGLYSGLYQETDAIEDLSFLSGSAAFLAGSSASLYGIKAA